MTSEEVVEYLGTAENESLMLLEPRSTYDACLVGVGYRYCDGPLAVYDIAKVMAVLIAGGMDEEAAQEWINTNMIGSWMGNGTPLFIEL